MASGFHKGSYCCIAVIILLMQGLTAESSIAAPLSSRVAVSQSGQFAVTANALFRLDSSPSSDYILYRFYRSIFNKEQIILGAIVDNQSLNATCENPVFLKTIARQFHHFRPKRMHYLQVSGQRACQFSLPNKQIALIIEHPKPILRPSGERVHQIFVITSSTQIEGLKQSLQFKFDANTHYYHLLQMAQRYSIHRDDIDWAALVQRGRRYIGSNQELCQAIAAADKFLIPALYQQDKHSFMSAGNAIGQLCAAPTFKPEKYTTVSERKQWQKLARSGGGQRVKDYTTRYHGYSIGDKITYFYLPSGVIQGRAAIQRQISQGRSVLEKTNIDNACGLIVDLRFNHGGTLDPMLLSLASVLGHKTLFLLGGRQYKLDKDKNALLSINYQKRTIYRHSLYSGKPAKKIKKMPIAILTNWGTASAGEFVRIALANTNQTQIFGTATSGRTTILKSIYLIDGRTLHITSGRPTKSSGEHYPLSLPVQRMVNDDYNTLFNPVSDQVIQAATTWLLSSKTCRGR